MSLTPGTRLGPYDIVAPLGVGGMGEVYRATDTKLGREVAIKVLPAGVAQDAERLSRFRREAQLLASLNHPNIAAIYGLDEAGDTLFLVLELVEGEDLAERLKRGPIPVHETLEIAKQIAAALEGAHERGIVHRDLKPANVKLAPDEKVKVLDFGLAKAYASDVSGAGSLDSGNSPTMTHAATMAGMILGTAAYMSPEQARAKTVDKRADIWAFGVVLYEMLMGHPLFHGETVSDTLAAVLTRDLDAATLPEEAPAALKRLLRRCLERNPKNRLHDIADARIVIDELLDKRPDMADPRPSTDVAGTAGGAGWPARLAWLAAGVAVGALAIAGLDRTLFVAAPVAPPVVRSLTYSGSSGSPSISADGKNVVFASDRDGTSRIWLKQLATGEEVALTQGADFGPRISPDSSSVLFLRAAEVGVDLYRVPLIGGEPRRLARNAGPTAWSPDGRSIAFTRDLGQRSALIVIPADGGEERVLVERQGTLRDVAWSPDGTRIAVEEAARVNTIGHRVLGTVDVKSGTFREFHRFPAGSVASGVRWDGDDAFVFAYSPTQAARGEVVLERLTLGSATPRPVFSFTSLPTRVEVAGPGALVFDGGGAHQNLFELGDGKALGHALTGGPTVDRQPAFSPDGRRVVFSSDRSGSLDLWSLEVATGAVRRLTFDAADDWDPQWTPDGKHLIWSSNRAGHFEVWIAESDGTGARQVTSDGVDAENPTMSADGSWIVYSSGNSAAPGIWKIHPDGSGAKLLLAGNFLLPELAPRSGWIAAVETGARSDNVSPIRIIRLEDGASIAELSVPGRDGNTGRSRWTPDGRSLVSWGEDDKGLHVLYRQPIVPGLDTREKREVVAVSDDRRSIESFGISPVDGRFVVSAGWGERDVMMAEGIPGIGESLRKKTP
jgi:eukaryotic-like serine/threonine-protein kinase